MVNLCYNLNKVSLEIGLCEDMGVDALVESLVGGTHDRVEVG